jgi:hypothetical protein
MPEEIATDAQIILVQLAWGGFWSLVFSRWSLGFSLFVFADFCFWQLAFGGSLVFDHWSLGFGFFVYFNN